MGKEESTECPGNCPTKDEIVKAYDKYRDSQFRFEDVDVLLEDTTLTKI